LQRLPQRIGAETRAYDCAVVEVTGLYPMCGGHVLDWTASRRWHRGL